MPRNLLDADLCESRNAKRVALALSLAVVAASAFALMYSAYCVGYRHGLDAAPPSKAEPLRIEYVPVPGMDRPSDIRNAS